MPLRTLCDVLQSEDEDQHGVNMGNQPVMHLADAVQSLANDQLCDCMVDCMGASEHDLCKPCIKHGKQVNKTMRLPEQYLHRHMEQPQHKQSCVWARPIICNNQK